MATALVNFNVPDTGSYTNPNLTILGSPAKITSGKVYDAEKNALPSKLIYTAVEPDRNLSVRSTIILSEDVPTITGNFVGPALFVKDGPNAGKGYMLRLQGSELRFNKVDNVIDLGTYLGGHNPVTLVAGDEIALNLDASGNLTAEINGTIVKTFTAQTDYFNELYPAAAAFWSTDPNDRGIAQFRAENLVGGSSSVGFWERSFTGNQDVFNDVDLQYIHSSNPDEYNKLENGVVVPITRNYYAKMVRPGTYSRAGNIRSTIRIGLGPTVAGESFGPGLHVPSGANKAKGYFLRLNGVRPYLYQQDTVGVNDLGNIVVQSFDDLPLAVGDFITLELTPANKINAYYNGAAITNITDVAVTDYVNEVIPSTVNWTAQIPGGIRGHNYFKAEGLTAAAPGGQLTLISVNNNNVIVSKSAITVQVTSGNGVTSASLSDGVNTHPLVISGKSDTVVNINAVDIHNTRFVPAGGVILTLSDGTTTLTKSVQFNGESAYKYTTATSIDPVKGLLKDYPAAAPGDGYDGQKIIAGSTVDYFPAGPHRQIIPAVPDGTASTGYWYDASAKTWTRIDEITYQNSIISPPVWSTIPNQSTEIGSLPGTLDVKPYVTTGGGTLTNWSLSGQPSGMSINQSGVITYNGPVGSSAGIRVTVSNGATATSSAFTWTITTVAATWAGAPNPPDCSVGEAYSYSFGGLCIGTRPITFAIKDGSLPAGLSISGEAITGTPTESGTFTGIVMSTSTGSDSPAFSITSVSSGELAQDYAHNPLRLATVRGDDRKKVFVKDPDAVLDYAIDWEPWLSGDPIISSTWTVPSGLTQPRNSAFNSTMGVVWLSGGQVGTTYNVEQRIITSAGRKDDRTIQITIAEK